MANNPRYQVTIYDPEPRTVPAGAQDALAHALGAAARLLLGAKKSLAIEATDDGKFYFYENSENSKGACLGEVGPISSYRIPRPKPPPTLRARGARPASGWYWWGDRNPDRIPEPPAPPMDKGWDRGYVYGFFTRSHELLGYAPAKERHLSYLQRRATIRDRLVPPNPQEVPAGAYYVVVYERERGVSRPILYGLIEDFTT